MITVTIFREDEYVRAFELKGHANSGPYGYDLVCAAVSAISFGAVNAIDALTDVTPEVTKRNDGGYLYVKIPQVSEQAVITKVQTIIDTMLVSLRTIERDYSSFIRIKDTSEGGAASC